MRSNDEDEKLKLLSSQPPEESVNFHETHDPEAPLDSPVPMGGTIEYFRVIGSGLLYLNLLLLALSTLAFAIGAIFTPGWPLAVIIICSISTAGVLLLMMLIPARYELYKGGLRIHLSFLGYFGWGPKLNYPASEFTGSSSVFSRSCGKWRSPWGDIVSLPRHQKTALEITPENVEHFQSVFQRIF